MSIQNGDDVQPGAWRIDYAGEARERFLQAAMQSRGETVEVVLTDGRNFTATLLGRTDGKLSVRRTSTGSVEYVPLWSDDGPELERLLVY